MELTTQKNHKIKHLLKILIPVLIYQLANYSAQFIDTVMTGRYNEVHLAGVSIGGSLYSPFFTMVKRKEKRENYRSHASIFTDWNFSCFSIISFWLDIFEAHFRDYEFRDFGGKDCV